MWRNYGVSEEYRPYWKLGYDLMPMTPHLFVCDIAAQLQPVRMQSPELANGMRPRWLNLHEAIGHNQAVMQRQESSMGQSIQRASCMLNKLAAERLGAG